MSIQLGAGCAVPCSFFAFRLLGEKVGHGTHVSQGELSSWQDQPLTEAQIESQLLGEGVKCLGIGWMLGTGSYGQSTANGVGFAS